MRCQLHPAYDVDYCPSCGTARQIGETTEDRVARRTRYAIRIDRDAATWFVYLVQPLTNVSWTEDRRDAKTWASASAARQIANARQITDYTIEEITR